MFQFVYLVGDLVLFFLQAYVQQLETSRLKLIQLEQELDRARQQVNEMKSILPFFRFPKYIAISDRNLCLQGFYVGNGIDTNSIGFSETMNPGLY